MPDKSLIGKKKKKKIALRKNKEKYGVMINYCKLNENRVYEKQKYPGNIPVAHG